MSGVQLGLLLLTFCRETGTYNESRPVHITAGGREI